jgi:glycosyltransferase involved in cell wall biosynthesis
MAPVSVLVPTFNRSAYLREALESILSQSTPPEQIVVIDDGSADDTEQVVRAFGDRVEYHRQGNSGKSAALNLGLAHVRNDYVWIFDDDDIAAPNALEALYEALRSEPSAGFSYGRCDKFFETWPAQERILNYAFRAECKQALNVKLMEGFFLWQGAMLVRRECYREVGPFDTRLFRSQDYEMSLRLARRFEGVAVPVVAFHQRQHRGTRGPQNAKIPASKVEDAWRKYNRIIFREIHGSHDLEELYIPSATELPAERRRMVALVQRASIMAREGIWDLAVADFREAADLARSHGFQTLQRQEIAALQAIFQPTAGSVLNDSQEARAFSSAISAFGPKLSRAVAANLLFPVTYRIRRVMQHPAPLEESRQLQRIVTSLFSIGCLPPLLEARRNRVAFFRASILEVN